MNTTNRQDAPTAHSIERDADGRLVALAIDGTVPLPASNENTWLVAIDGSAHALRAVAEAADLAARMNACALHLVNVQPWLSKEAAETGLAQRGWAASETARELLDARRQAWRLHVVMGDAVAGIGTLAATLACRGIIVGSRGLGAAENLLVGSVAYKLIHLSPVPVLVVR